MMSDADMMQSMSLAAFWLHLHWIFGGMLLTGGLILIPAAVKYMHPQRLKPFIITLIVVGILGTLATAPLAAKSMHTMMQPWMTMNKQMMMQSGMMPMMNGSNGMMMPMNESMMRDMMPPGTQMPEGMMMDPNNTMMPGGMMMDPARMPEGTVKP